MHDFKRGKFQFLEREEAETTALKCITFLVEEPTRIARFMATTGIEAQELAKNIGKIPLLAATLEYLIKEESLLLMFSTNHRISIKTINAAYTTLEKLAGGEIGESL